MASREEAETAMLTVGAVLEWEAVTPGVLQRARLGPNESCRCYSVTLDTDHPSAVCVEVSYYWVNDHHTQAWGLPPPENEELTPYHWYPSVAEAKAACEVHAATGAFPPGVKPDLPPPVYRRH